MDALRMIKVWRFEDAPEELQELSANGGDEDWLAVVPPALAEEYINWIESNQFGCFDTQRIPRPDGSVIYIGSHS